MERITQANAATTPERASIHNRDRVCDDACSTFTSHNE
jgi:hypothetical protein